MQTCTRLLWRPSCFLVAVALATLASSATAVPTTIVLSELSSDETSAADLDGSMTFEVTGASELTITVANSSVFEISGIYFNADTNVSGLTLDASSDAALAGWDFIASGSKSNQAGGFGTFGFALEAGTAIDGGSELAFVFAIDGAGPFTERDFTGILSRPPPGNSLSAIAAKFVRGPGDDSAFGASGTVTPEPGTGLLLALGLLALGRRPGRGA